MNAIFAVNSINGFGVDKTMPWPHSSVDLQRFKELTRGHTVVMGSTTWLSDMPKPLPGRRNCVLSHTLRDDRCEVFPNITTLMMNLRTDEEVFVIGGATVLWELRPFINRVYLTRHLSRQRADVTLDTEKYLDGFKIVHWQQLEELSFDTYERIAYTR